MIRLILALLFLCDCVRAQEPVSFQEEIVDNIGLEDLSESDESEPEDDYRLVQLLSFKTRPANVNDPGAMSELPLLNALQRENLLTYRRILGDLVSVYELQAVPGFDSDLIRSMLPYVTIDAEQPIKSIKESLSGGQHKLVVRPSFVGEPAKGFVSSDSTQPAFLGSRPKLFFRYRYQNRRDVQYGITGEKDAGEPFAFNGQQYAFDFTSVHFFVREKGPVRAFALGDFTINLGQGLIHWQSLAFKKSSAVTDIKRQSEVMRPYHSSGEFNFMRGVGLTLRKNFWEATIFGSRRSLTANMALDDSGETVVTSFQTFGLHRTVSELSHRNKVMLNSVGGNLRYTNNGSQIGMNLIRHGFSVPLLRRDEPYNLFTVKGNRWLNASVDYAHTVHNIHFFGEAAINQQRGQALLNGLMASLHEKVSIAVLHRLISKNYQSFAGNAFTENSMPTNERGLYTGLSIRPEHGWKIDVYADFFKFPWLKYRVDAPTFGRQLLLQISWAPAKGTEIYTRMRHRNKARNSTSVVSGLEPHSPPPWDDFPEIQPLRYPEIMSHMNWRTHINFKAGRDIMLRSRIELCWFRTKQTGSTESGSLFFADLHYKPFGKPWGGNLRIQLFESDSYDSRLYAYENDVLFSSSTPFFFHRGARIYLNLRAKISPGRFKGLNIDLGMKLSTTVYQNLHSVGSGPDEIMGNRKSEIKLQVYVMPG